MLAGQKVESKVDAMAVELVGDWAALKVGWTVGKMGKLMAAQMDFQLVEYLVAWKAAY